MSVLVAGGAGYIGSHTVIELAKSGEEFIIVDNFCNSKKEVIERLEKIIDKKIKFYEADLCDKNSVFEIFEKEKIDSIIHFAGFKAVGESVEKPIEYYRNNLESTFNLIDAMRKFNVKNFVFSSSATVYGTPESLPITEEFPLSATNPYGRTKLFIEEILKDLHFADNSFNIAILRYFNPIGADESGSIGEDPNGIPNNLMPYISQVAVGKLKKLRVFGNDYETIDGTGVRDYIHVVDLAKGHILALNKLKQNPGLVVYNLGTGKGTSVLELVSAFEKANNVKIPYEIVERRPGDIAECYAGTQKAEKELGFKAEFDILRMCKDSFRWQQNNPKGF